VNLFLTPHTTGVFSRAGILSPVGRCKTLDADADGYARGEACRTVLLESKSCDAATFAVVLGSAVNQDGRSSSLTAPNGPAQQDVMRGALRSRATGMACELQVMELHGTGTPLGDPIEVGAVAAVLLPHRTAPLTLQSAKACIGHCETAAGVAGLMQLAAGLGAALPTPLLHLRTPNAHVTSVLRLAVQSTSATVVLPKQAAPTVRACGVRAESLNSFFRGKIEGGGDGARHFNHPDNVSLVVRTGTRHDVSVFQRRITHAIIIIITLPTVVVHHPLESHRSGCN
jgi:acyl transferase domain-containing protein